MGQWPDYPALGLRMEHVPDLIRMTLDDELHGADSDSREVWAPLHAWRALGQLRAESAIKPLTQHPDARTACVAALAQSLEPDVTLTTELSWARRSLARYMAPQLTP